MLAAGIDGVIMLEKKLGQVVRALVGPTCAFCVASCSGPAPKVPAAPLSECALMVAPLRSSAASCSRPISPAPGPGGWRRARLTMPPVMSRPRRAMPRSAAVKAQRRSGPAAVAVRMFSPRPRCLYHSCCGSFSPGGRVGRPGLRFSLKADLRRAVRPQAGRARWRRSPAPAPSGSAGPAASCGGEIRAAPRSPDRRGRAPAADRTAVRPGHRGSRLVRP